MSVDPPIRKTRVRHGRASIARIVGRSAKSDRGADHVAPDCSGQNFYATDRGLRDLLKLYLEPDDLRRPSREIDKIAFGDFQFHAMSHRAGALGMDRPLPAVAKYALQYLFVQAEFGLMCPINVTDTSIHLVRIRRRHDYLLPKCCQAMPPRYGRGRSS